MTRVVVFGPNVRFDDGRTLHVHAAGCQHLQRLPYRDLPRNSDVGGWEIDVTTEAEVVEDIYPAGDFEYDPTDPIEYEQHRSDITIFPCAGLTAARFDDASGGTQ